MKPVSDAERRRLLDPLYLAVEEYHSDTWFETAAFHGLVMTCQNRLEAEYGISPGYEYDDETFHGPVSTQLESDMETREFTGDTMVYDHGDDTRTIGEPLPEPDHFSATAIMPTLDVPRTVLNSSAARLQQVEHVLRNPFSWTPLEEMNRERARNYAERDVCGVSGEDIAQAVDEVVAQYTPQA